jgi:hypothetical protein
MNNVPKFVRQRMARPGAGDHPDANLLAAVHEGGLTKQEREQVLLHLANCSACREALALALPEVAEHSAAASSAARWLRWPMLRWAGVAAAVVVVAAAVVIQSSRRSVEVPRAMTEQQAASAEKPEPAISVEANAPTAVLRDQAQVKTRSSLKKEVEESRGLREKAEKFAEKDSADKKLLDRKQDALAGRAGSNAPAMAQATNRLAQQNEEQQLQGPAAKQSYDEVTKNAQQQQNSSVKAPNTGMIATEQRQAQPPPPQAPASQANAVESVDVRGQGAPLEMQKAKTQDRAGANVDKQTAAREGSAELSSSLGTEDTAVVGGATASTKPAPTRGPLMRAAGSVTPRWRLGANGILERSVDAGRSWQLVRLGAPVVKLRALSAVGPDIWAGGAGGALYHSADNGQTWARVTMKTGDVDLKTDIVRVEFTDAQHGVVTTSAGESWITENAGAGWAVQR